MEDTPPSSSGDGQVDRILSRLDELDRVPVAEHAPVFLDVHDRLGRQLTPEQTVRGAGAHGSP